MGANATSVGDLVKLSDLDALYLRLYNLKMAHINDADQINQSALTIPAENSGLTQGSKVEVSTAKIATLKSELANLAQSQWYQSDTTNTIVTMTDFSTDIKVPNIGDLLKSTDFNLIETAITSAEAIVPTYSNKYNARYSGRYGSCYSSRYGTCYSGCYGSCYSGRYNTRYGTCYSRYSGRYGTCYSCYSFRYGSRYGYRYRGRSVQIRC